MTRDDRSRRSRHRHKQNNNRQLSLEQQFRSQLRLHAEATAQQLHALEREKVLCDQVLHQKFLNELLVTVVAGEPSPQQHGEQELPGQQQQVPCSHIAELLRRDVSQQVQQVLKMTAADWLHMFADLFPKVVFMLELCHRSGQQAGLTAPPGQPEDDPSVTDNAPLQQQDMLTVGPADNNRSSGPHMVPSQLSTPAWPTTRTSPGGSSSGSSLLAQWFGAQPPLGQSPAADYEQLREVINEVVTLVMLAYIFNHVPLLQACAFSYSPGPQVRPTAQHWEVVADRLQLTELQELHWTLCLAEYRRLNQSSRADGDALIREAATPSLLVAAAERQQQQAAAQQRGAADAGGQQQGDAEPTSQGRSRGARSRTRQAARRSGGVAAESPASALQQQHQQPPPSDWIQGSDQAAAPEAAGPGQQDAGEGGALDELTDKGQDQLEQGLQQYVQRRHVHLLSTATFFINSLSPYQLALLISHCYPWLPSFTAAADVVSRRWHARQQRQLRQIQQTGLQEDLTSPAGSRAASPAAGAGGAAGGGDSSQGTRAGSAAGSGGFLALEIKRHEQRRVAELELHRKLCWAQVNAVMMQQQEGQQQQQQGEGEGEGKGQDEGREPEAAAAVPAA